MKREPCETVGGKQVVRLIPETVEDLAELRRLDEAGLLDARSSFGDDPDTWIKAGRTRRKKAPARR